MVIPSSLLTSKWPPILPSPLPSALPPSSLLTCKHVPQLHPGSLHVHLEDVAVIPQVDELLKLKKRSGYKGWG